MSRDYDVTDPKSIERYGQRLVGRSLRQVLAAEDRTAYQAGNGKGNLGDMVERSFFGINPGNMSAPDFFNAGVELKTTPLKRVGKRLRAKERLSLQMIDYDALIGDTWEQSAFLSKNAMLLLVFYLYEKGKTPLDYVFEIVRLWEFPEEDIEIIRDDWETIRAKVARGEAHLLSEGDTQYLAACTKGAKGTDRRKQPMSSELAKPRAFSLKASYMNSVIEGSLKARSAFTASELRSGRTLEQLVHERFSEYLGLRPSEISDRLGLATSPQAKNYYAALTKKILGVGEKEEIAEFKKADLVVKTIRLKPTGMPKEAVSFPAFDYLDLVQQEWDESDLRAALTRRFLFVIYQLDRTGEPVLLRTQFWTMPIQDVDGPARECFERTVDLIREDRAEYLPGSRDNAVCHVRPHGRNAEDKLPTPSGRMVTRKSFWLNQKYLAGQLSDLRDR